MLLIFLGYGDDALEFLGYSFIVFLVLHHFLTRGSVFSSHSCRQAPRVTYIDYRHYSSYPGGSCLQGWDYIPYLINDIEENFGAIINSLGHRLGHVVAVNEVSKGADVWQ